MCRQAAKLGKRMTKAKAMRKPWAINMVVEEEEEGPPWPDTAAANVPL